MGQRIPVASNIYISVLHWSTGSWFSVAIVTAYMRRQMYSSSATQPTQILLLTLLRVVLILVFVPVTRSLFN